MMIKMKTQIAPVVAQPALFRPALPTSPRTGGMFYRWHMRRMRLRELQLLLTIRQDLLQDIGVSRDQVRAEIASLRRSPL